MYTTSNKFSHIFLVLFLLVLSSIRSTALKKQNPTFTGSEWMDFWSFYGENTDPNNLEKFNLRTIGGSWASKTRLCVAMKDFGVENSEIFIKTCDADVKDRVAFSFLRCDSCKEKFPKVVAKPFPVYIIYTHSNPKMALYADGDDLKANIPPADIENDQRYHWTANFSIKGRPKTIYELKLSLQFMSRSHDNNKCIDVWNNWYDRYGAKVGLYQCSDSGYGKMNQFFWLSASDDFAPWPISRPLPPGKSVDVNYLF